MTGLSPATAAAVAFVAGHKDIATEAPVEAVRFAVDGQLAQTSADAGEVE